MPSRGDLREDRERDFRRVAAAQVETDGPVEPADLFRGEARFDEPLAAELLGLPGADSMYIGSLSR